MTDFDKYKELYQCDFSKSTTDVSATAYSQARLQQREQEHQLQRLFEFIKLWKDWYELFCENFDSYSYTAQIMPIWSTEQREKGYIPLAKSEFYIDSFFNMILNKIAKFEVQQYKDYVWQNGKTSYYTSQTNQNILISSNTFILSGGDTNYQLDTAISAALVCSLIVALSNNYIIYEWYSKQSRFKEFIDNVSKSHCFIRFSINDNTNRVHIGGGTKESLSIDIDRNWLYFVISNETLRVENMLCYNHLDCLFGKDRKEPLTKEDLQLYSIVNEGRKPLMYDFEF